jgi:hypothetical protein
VLVKLSANVPGRPTLMLVVAVPVSQNRSPLMSVMTALYVEWTFAAMPSPGRQSPVPAGDASIFTPTIVSPLWVPLVAVIVNDAVNPVAVPPDDVTEPLSLNGPG